MTKNDEDKVRMHVETHCRNLKTCPACGDGKMDVAEAITVEARMDYFANLGNDAGQKQPIPSRTLIPYVCSKCSYCVLFSGKILLP